MEQSGAKWQRGDEVFAGTYFHNIDEKGRMIVPAKFREGLCESFYVTIGDNGCLFAYPLEEWRKVEEKLSAVGANAQKIKRIFFANACECEVDKQGRTLIPAKLREFAGITKDVVVLGVSNKVELWAKERWNEYIGSEAETLEEISSQIELLGL